MGHGLVIVNRIIYGMISEFVSVMKHFLILIIQNNT